MINCFPHSVIFFINLYFGLWQLNTFVWDYSVAVGILEFYPFDKTCVPVIIDEIFPAPLPPDLANRKPLLPAGPIGEPGLSAAVRWDCEAGPLGATAAVASSQGTM